MSLISKLEHEAVVADGALGTQLEENRGLSAGLNLTHPDEVRECTEAYIEAGAQMVRTNTFGATQPVLQAYGLADKEDEINEKGAQIALECVRGTEIDVAGSVGPTGLHFAPAGYTNFDAAVQIFTVQFRALKKAGIHILSLESFSDITEMRAAIMAANHLGGFEIVASMVYGGSGKTFTGTPARACAVICESLGAGVVGANCGTDPRHAQAVMQDMASSVRVPLSAMPSAGQPDKQNGEYPAGPEAFAADMLMCADAGARLLGGCCGTTPTYIRDIRKALQKRPLPSRVQQKGAWIASPLGALDLSRDGLRFAQMDLPAVKEQMEDDDFSSVSYALPADWEFCDACVLDFHGLEDDFDVQKLVTAVTLYLKKPVIVAGGTSELVELFLRYYPGRAAVLHRARMLDLPFGALVVGRGYKPITEQSAES